MSKSWNAGNPSTFCNIYHHRVAREKLVPDPRTGRMTEEFWLLSRNERWAALVSNNPHLPIRALRLLMNKYDHINARSEINHAKRNDSEGWGNSKAYIRHRDRTLVRSRVIPQELEQYAADQVQVDEWGPIPEYDQWWEVMYDLWAEEDDAEFAWYIRASESAHWDDTYELDEPDPWLEGEGEIHAPPADPELVSEDPEFDAILAFAKIFGESFQRVVNNRHYTR